MGCRGSFSPLTGAWLLPVRLPAHAGGAGKLAGMYRRLLHLALRHRLATIGAALLALALSMVGVTHMQGEFFRPPIAELLVSLSLPANASQTETEKQVERTGKVLDWQ